MDRDLRMSMMGRDHATYLGIPTSVQGTAVTGFPIIEGDVVADEWDHFTNPNDDTSFNEIGQHDFFVEPEDSGTKKVVANCVRQLTQVGMLHLPGLLPKQMCDQILEACKSQFENATQESLNRNTKYEDTPIQGDTTSCKFPMQRNSSICVVGQERPCGDIHGGGQAEGGFLRDDLKLTLTPFIRDVLSYILTMQQLGAVMLKWSECLDLAPFCELACLRVKPAATSQPIHSDSSWFHGRSSLTVFIAIHDILSPDFAPTCMYPFTHCVADAHSYDARTKIAREVFEPAKKMWETRKSHEESGRGTRDCGKNISKTGTDYTRAIPCLLKVGEAVVMDSRLLHHGLANTTSETRYLFYFTISLGGHEGPVGSTLTMLRKYQDKIRIRRSSE